MPEANPGTEAQAVIPGKTITLPSGILRDGKVHREAEIIPMTGLTRKSIAREDVRTNASKVTDVILLQCVKKIGPVTAITNKLIGELLLGDRDALLLEIRRVSMGDIVTATVECDGCQNKIEVKFNLDEIVTTELKEGTFEIKDGQRVFRVQNAALQINALFRFPKGEDQQAILPFLQKNPVDANFRLYALCLMEWNGKVGPFDGGFFERLPVSVLDAVDDQFSEVQPGPDLRQNVSCPVCTKDIEMTFQGSDFLFRLPKRGRMS